MLGREVTVLTDSIEAAGSKVAARTEWQAPEIDGVVHVSGVGLRSGQFMKVLVVDSNEYDLFGKAVS